MIEMCNCLGHAESSVRTVNYFLDRLYFFREYLMQRYIHRIPQGNFSWIFIFCSSFGSKFHLYSEREKLFNKKWFLDFMVFTPSTKVLWGVTFSLKKAFNGGQIFLGK